MDKADDKFHYKEYGDAINLLSRVPDSERGWRYHFLYGACLYETGRTKESSENFDVVFSMLEGEKFSPEDRWHASVYIFKKYGFRTDRSGYGLTVAEADPTSKSIKGIIKRCMPLE